VTNRQIGRANFEFLPLIFGMFPPHLELFFAVLVAFYSLEILVSALLMLRQWDGSHSSHNGLLTAKLVGQDIYNSPS
jgi:hypothetical protein